MFEPLDRDEIQKHLDIYRESGFDIPYPLKGICKSYDSEDYNVDTYIKHYLDKTIQAYSYPDLYNYLNRLVSDCKLHMVGIPNRTKKVLNWLQINRLFPKIKMVTDTSFKNNYILGTINRNGDKLEYQIRLRIKGKCGSGTQEMSLDEQLNYIEQNFDTIWVCLPCFDEAYEDFEHFEEVYAHMDDYI